MSSFILESAPDEAAIAQVTSLLRGLAENRHDGLAGLFALVQRDLRRIAHRERLAVQAGDTLSTTALVNDAYLKLCDADLPAFADRRHFYAIAARAMRQLLIDYARTRAAQKRGGGMAAVELTDRLGLADDPDDAARALELGEALDRLEQHSPRLAQVVYLRFYAGLSDAEIGRVFDLDESTVRRDWLKARGWLFRTLNPADPA
ncbi:MAG TPA: ECF-type sigma factor [Rudaea sp.]|nr:ECF-type sigma factor [Rudaea sp.]